MIPRVSWVTWSETLQDDLGITGALGDHQESLGSSGDPGEQCLYGIFLYQKDFYFYYVHIILIWYNGTVRGN